MYLVPFRMPYNLSVVFYPGLVMAVVLEIFFWRIYVKAGRPGWVSLIPIYNLYVLLKIVKLPWWYLVGLFVPLINIVVLVGMQLRLARMFGRSTAFGVVALILFAPVGLAILAFGKDKYRPAKLATF